MAAGLTVFIVWFVCGAALALFACKNKILALQRQINEKQSECFADWVARQRKDDGDGTEV